MFDCFKAIKFDKNSGLERGLKKVINDSFRKDISNDNSRVKKFLLAIGRNSPLWIPALLASLHDTVASGKPTSRKIRFWAWLSINMEQLAFYLFAVPSLYAWLTLITLVIGRVLFSMIIRYLGTSVQFAPISELTQKVAMRSEIINCFLQSSCPNQLNRSLSRSIECAVWTFSSGFRWSLLDQCPFPRPLSWPSSTFGSIVKCSVSSRSSSAWE